MIKKAWFAALFLMVMAATAYAAPDRVGKVDVGFNISGAIPRDGDLDSAAYYGGSFAYGVTDWLALGAESGWAQFSASDAGITIDQDTVPLFGDIILRVPTGDSQLKPYGIVGLGVLFVDASTNISNISIKADTSFAAKFGGGVDWYINNNWALNFEASYVVSNVDGTVTNTSTGASASVSGDSDYWMVGGGVKYLFS